MCCVISGPVQTSLGVIQNSRRPFANKKSERERERENEKKKERKRENPFPLN